MAMTVQSKYLFPTRADAVRLRRSEKDGVFYLMFAVHTLIDVQEALKDRFSMVDDGEKRFQKIIETTEQLLQEIRMTIPENQRDSIQRTAEDCEVKLIPKAIPDGGATIINKEDYRALVDSARAKCMDCILDDNECEGCELFRLLTCVLPMDDYHAMNLCVYNLGEWVD